MEIPRRASLRRWWKASPALEAPGLPLATSSNLRARMTNDERGVLRIVIRHSDFVISPIRQYSFPPRGLGGRICCRWGRWRRRRGFFLREGRFCRGRSGRRSDGRGGSGKRFLRLDFGLIGNPHHSAHFLLCAGSPEHCGEVGVAAGKAATRRMASGCSRREKSARLMRCRGTSAKPNPFG